MASDESSTRSSPLITRLTSKESAGEFCNDSRILPPNPLRCFRNLSPDYIEDCKQTEEELTKLFHQADRQQILYCLKHVNSGHSKDALMIFHRQLDALYVWYNLYYELTISIRKLSCLLRCCGCDDWPNLRIRSIATARERKAKKAENDDWEADWAGNESFDEDNNNEEINDDSQDEDETDDARLSEESGMEEEEETEATDHDEELIDDDDDLLAPVRRSRHQLKIDSVFRYLDLLVGRTS